MLKKLLFTTVLATGLTFAASGSVLAESYNSANQAESVTAEQQFNYATAEDLSTAELVSGEVLSIKGRNFMIRSENGPVSVDTMSFMVDPAGEYVTPSVQIGDQVQILATATELPGAFNAQRIETIKKSYSDRVYSGQALTLDGLDFIEGQKTAAVMMENQIEQ
jgi:hypothetical protein